MSFKIINEIIPDGSSRRFLRVKGDNGDNLILIRPSNDSGGMREQEAFFNIGSHLYRKGVRVPRIHLYDRASGEILVDDLGDLRFYNIISGLSCHADIISYYKRAIKLLFMFQTRATSGFDIRWCCGSWLYDSEFSFEREALYFARYFLKEIAKIDIDSDSAVKKGLYSLCRRVDLFSYRGWLIHRDFQSRNIMSVGQSLYIIDFQGAMVGPLFYDIASLLHDPYIRLPYSIKTGLFEYYLEKIMRYIPLDREMTQCARKEFEIISILRIMQAIGAYGFLSQEKKKPFFKQFIPIALEILDEILTNCSVPLYELEWLGPYL